jgi:copper transport protein
LVAWRVISSDSHPVQGAFTYRVGLGEAVIEDTATAAVDANQGSSQVVGGLFFGVRLGAYAALMLLVGGTAFVAFLWPEGARSRRTRRIIWVGWGGSLFFAAAGIVMQGAYAASISVISAMSPTIVVSVLSTTFGTYWGARVFLLLLAAPLILLFFKNLNGAAPEAPVHEAETAANDQTLASSATNASEKDIAVRRPGAWWYACAVVLGSAIAATFGMAGHPGVGHPLWLSAGTDLIHLTAAAAWLGGLVILVSCTLPTAGEPVLARVVSRFSTLALWCVIAIAATGGYQAWRQVGSLQALATTYGGWLILKVMVVLVLIGVASMSRAWVRRMSRHRARSETDEAPTGPTRRELKMSVLAELALAFVVLALTTGLVSAQPARYAISQPFSANLEGEKYSLTLIVDPAKRGLNTMHMIAIKPDGTEEKVDEITARLSLPSRDIEALRVEAVRAGEGHFIATGVDIPVAGDWQLEVLVRVGEFDQTRFAVTVPLR